MTLHIESGKGCELGCRKTVGALSELGCRRRVGALGELGCRKTTEAFCITFFLEPARSSSWNIPALPPYFHMSASVCFQSGHIHSFIHSFLHHFCTALIVPSVLQEPLYGPGIGERRARPPFLQRLYLLREKGCRHTTKAVSAHSQRGTRSGLSLALNPIL